MSSTILNYFLLGQKLKKFVKFKLFMRKNLTDYINQNNYDTKIYDNPESDYFNDKFFIDYNL